MKDWEGKVLSLRLLDREYHRSMSKPLSKNKTQPNRGGGLKKPHPYSHTKSGGAIGDNSMAESEAWHQKGCGVDETVHDVGAMPNASILSDEDVDHLR